MIRRAPSPVNQYLCILGATLKIMGKKNVNEALVLGYNFTAILFFVIPSSFYLCILFTHLLCMYIYLSVNLSFFISHFYFFMLEELYEIHASICTSSVENPTHHASLLLMLTNALNASSTVTGLFK